MFHPLVVVVRRLKSSVRLLIPVSLTGWRFIDTPWKLKPSVHRPARSRNCKTEALLRELPMPLLHRK